MRAAFVPTTKASTSEGMTRAAILCEMLRR
jgi:hypothetical protein